MEAGLNGGLYRWETSSGSRWSGGAASALYGGNAMGGVINIITKTPEKLELEATGGYGTHDAYRYRFAFGNKILDRLSFRLGYEKEGTDGYETTPVVRSISTGNGTVSGGYPMNDSSGNPTRWVVGDKGENGAQRHAVDGKLSFDFSDTGYLSFTAVSGRHEYDYGPPSHIWVLSATVRPMPFQGLDNVHGFSPMILSVIPESAK